MKKLLILPFILVGCITVKCQHAVEQKAVAHRQIQNWYTDTIDLESMDTATLGNLARNLSSFLVPVGDTVQSSLYPDSLMTLDSNGLMKYIPKPTNFY